MTLNLINSGPLHGADNRNWLGVEFPDEDADLGIHEVVLAPSPLQLLGELIRRVTAGTDLADARKNHRPVVSDSQRPGEIGYIKDGDVHQVLGADYIIGGRAWRVRLRGGFGF